MIAWLRGFGNFRVGVICVVLLSQQPELVTVCVRPSQPTYVTDVQ